MSLNLKEIGAFVFVLIFYSVIYLLKKKKHIDFSVLTLLSVVFGVIVGLVFQNSHGYYSIFGTIYTNLIGAVVVPLLLFSIISSITNMGAVSNLKKIGGKSVLFLLLNTLIASVLALIFSIVFPIGHGFVYDISTDYQAVEVPAFTDTITSLFPTNLIVHWSKGEVVPIVIFSLLVGISYNQLSACEVKGIGSFKKFVDGANLVMGNVVEFIIELTPYAVLSLIAKAVSQSSLQNLLPLLSVLLLVYILCIIQIFGVESLLLLLIGKLNPIRFFRGIFPAGIVAFTSQSSIGTIPVTRKQLKDVLGVHEDIASFVAMLGANLGMPGCAGIWPVVTAIFTIHMLGLKYTPTQYIFLIVLTLVVAVGTVGVPGAATISATAVFVAAGLPVEALVILSPISSIADMVRTSTNVIGASTAAVLVAKTEGELDLEVYNQQKGAIGK